MASAHHLLAAAFSLCGLLFLLHVVTVNSIICKKCSSEDEGCLSGDVPEEDCRLNTSCRTVVFYNKNGLKEAAIRDCVKGIYHMNFCQKIDEEKNCHYFCLTDNCNNISIIP